MPEMQMHNDQEQESQAVELQRQIMTKSEYIEQLRRQLDDIAYENRQLK